MGSGKQLLAINVCILYKKKHIFLEINVGIGDSFPSEKAELYDVVSLKVGQLFT